MVVEVKARDRRHSLLYVQGAQRRDRPPGPFRTYNFKVDRVLAAEQILHFRDVKGGQARMKYS